MGFFDDLFDTKKKYTADDLLFYFRHEINGTLMHEFEKKQLTTNISKLIAEKIHAFYPNMNSWHTEEGSSYAQKYGDSSYILTFSGIIRSKDSYGDHLDALKYDITLYSDQYAHLVDIEKASIHIFK